MVLPLILIDMPRPSTRQRPELACISLMARKLQVLPLAAHGAERNHSPRRTDTGKGTTMNQDQAKGRWEQIKGRARKAWGELTDDDIMRAEGSEEKLFGLIQEKFGDSKEAIQAKLNKIQMN